MEPTQIAGLATGGLNFLTNGIAQMQNYALGIEDRKYQRELNEQAQKNFETQMAFAKAQADQQVRQFEANRIGNLTKEYAEAGLNPLLAAGMGQSTASSVGMGGLPHQSGTDPGTSNMIAATKAMQEQSSLVTMASVNKLNAEANLANAEADAVSGYKKDAFEKHMNLEQTTIDKINQEIENLKKQKEYQEKLNKIIDREVVQKEFETAVYKAMLDNGKDVKKMTKAEKKRVMAVIDKARKSNALMTSMTVENYTRCVNETAQTAINAYTGNSGTLMKPPTSSFTDWICGLGN